MQTIERKTTHYILANILFHCISNTQFGIKLNSERFNISMEFH
jgi:hypothetical protein